MSGGSLDYFYSSMEDHVGDFDDHELDDLVKDMAELFHAREWFLSADTNEGKWCEARDAFKAKWFTDAGRKERIEKYLDGMKEKMLKSLGMSDRYCRNCGNWTQDDRKHYEEYGDCCLHESCLMHRSESCEKFRKRGEGTDDG